MPNPLERIQQAIGKRRVTAALVKSLEALHRSGPERQEFDPDGTLDLLALGADVDAVGTHPRIGARVNLLALSIQNPQAAEILVAHGARFDNSLAAALKHLVVRTEHDLPMLSRTTRRLNPSTLEGVDRVLQAGPHPDFDRARFMVDLDEVVFDVTTQHHPQRRLRDILDERIEGFSALWQEMALDGQVQPVETARAARPRL